MDEKTKETALRDHAAKSGETEKGGVAADLRLLAAGIPALVIYVSDPKEAPPPSSQLRHRRGGHIREDIEKAAQTIEDLYEALKAACLVLEDIGYTNCAARARAALLRARGEA